MFDSDFPSTPKPVFAPAPTADESVILDSRAFVYHAKPPIENATAVQEQLHLAARYRDDQVVGTKREHEQYGEVMAPYWLTRTIHYQALMEEHAERCKEAKARGKEEPDAPEILRFPLLKRDIAMLKEASVECKAGSKAVWNGYKGRLGWGTRLHVNEAVNDSLQDRKQKPFSNPPYFRSFDGTGALVVQLQGGLPTSELLSGEDTQARLVPDTRVRSGHPKQKNIRPDKWRLLYLRIGSDEHRKPIWAIFPIHFHRPLPDAMVKEVRVHAVRVATKVTWTAQFSLESTRILTPLPAAAKGTVAIDVGWRQKPDGVRVVKWVDDEEKHDELLLTPRFFALWKKAEKLQGVRDGNFNVAVDEVLAYRRHAPEWFREATRGAHLWMENRSTRRLASLVWRWRTEHLPGDQDFCARLNAWRVQDRHLYEWQSNQRQQAMNGRKDLYRHFASSLVQRYSQVVFENLYLPDFAELPEKDKDEPEGIKRARPTRFKVCLSEFFACLKDAVVRAGGEWVSVDPAWTTQHCSKCNKREEFDAKDLMHQCSHCGHTWDQDWNASRNLLRAARCNEGVVDRSNPQTRVTEAKKRAEQRRKTMLARLSGRRSQKRS